MNDSDGDLAPFTFHLDPPFPNPFNSRTTIRFPVGLETDATRLAVYDLSGRMVADLFNSRGVLQYAPTSGDHTDVWDAAGLPSGVYLIKLESNEKSTLRKALLIR